MALVGVVVVVAGASSDGSSLEGNVLAVLNLLVFTGYFLLGKRARTTDVHAWSFLAAVFMGAASWSSRRGLLALVHDLDAIHGTDWLLLLGLILLPGHGRPRADDVGAPLRRRHRHVDDDAGQPGGVDRRRVDPLRPGAGPRRRLAGGVVVLAALGAILRRQRAERALAAEAALTGDLLDE